jgi:hypothetical protein
MPYNPDVVPYCTNGMSSEEYHASDPVSKSLLDALGKSTWHYEMTRQGLLEKKSNSMEIGTAVHLSVLQPHLFDQMIVCGPPDRRGNRWKEIVEQNPGKVVLIEEDYNEVFTLRQSIADHPMAQKILESSSEVEVSYFWREPETQIVCKCRPDLTIAPGKIFEPGLLVDLKVVAADSGSMERFTRYIEDYSYDMQAAFYLDGVRAVTGKPYNGFIFLVVEKETHLVSTFHLGADHDYVSGGRQRYMKRLFTLREYLDNPPSYLGYPATIQEIECRSWYRKQLEEGELK